MTVINTNIKSLVSQNALERNSRDLQKAMQQLSTGKRINSAADDAAGLAISDKMTAQIRGLNQAVRNANDGISLLQTAEGATQEITAMLQRMRELAVQAANDTYSSADRASLQLENDALEAEISRISDNTQFNGMYVFDVSATGALGDGSGNVLFQVGVNGTTGDTIGATLQSLDSTTLMISGISFATQSAAQGALTTLDGAIATVDSFRASLGATINRLTHAADNLTNVSLNTEASRSRILDTDYAKAASELSRTQIIQQAATAVLAQANVDQQSVLKLLQG
jgi:flagellin